MKKTIVLVAMSLFGCAPAHAMPEPTFDQVRIMAPEQVCEVPIGFLVQLHDSGLFEEEEELRSRMQSIDATGLEAEYYEWLYTTMENARDDNQYWVDRLQECHDKFTTFGK